MRSESDFVKPRILILLSSFSGGGAERTVVNLMNHFDRSKFEIKVMVMSDEGSLKTRIHREDIFSNTDCLLQQNLFSKIVNIVFNIFPFQVRTASSFNPDLLLTVTESMNYYGVLFSRLIPKPCKWVIRCGNNIFSESTSKPFPFNWILGKLLMLSYRNADHVLTISNGIKSSLKTRFGLVDSGVTVIYNPIDLDGIKSKLSIPAVLPSGVSKFIIAVGRLAHQKRFDVLIKAYSQSGIMNKGYHLIILGEGDKHKELAELSDQMNVDNHVHFLGFVENPYSYVSKARALILTSEWEGFAHVVAEALACDTNVIASDCQHGPSEILEAGKFGWLFEPLNVTQLAEKLRSVERISFEGKLTRAEEFRANKITRKYELLFENLILQNR